MTARLIDHARQHVLRPCYGHFPPSPDTELKIRYDMIFQRTFSQLLYASICLFCGAISIDLTRDMDPASLVTMIIALAAINGVGLKNVAARIPDSGQASKGTIPSSAHGSTVSVKQSEHTEYVPEGNNYVTGVAKISPVDTTRPYPASGLTETPAGEPAT